MGLAKQPSTCASQRTISNTPPKTNTPQSNGAMLAIAGRVKKARLGFKSFIPQEESRLSAIKAVDNVSACLGAIVPLLPHSFADAEVHNIRAAFIAGMAYALGKVTLILQPPDGPAPLDVRDMVRTYSQPDDIADHVAGQKFRQNAQVHE